MVVLSSLPKVHLRMGSRKSKIELRDSQDKTAEFGKESMKPKSENTIFYGISIHTKRLCTHIRITGQLFFWQKKHWVYFSSVTRLSEFEPYFTDQPALLGGVECTMAPNDPSIVHPGLNQDPRLYDQS